MESFITLPTEPTKVPYTAFCHGNLVVEMLSKIVSTIQDSANAVSANTFFCLESLQSPFTYSCQTICKTLDSFIIWTCGKWSHIFSSATFNSVTVLGFRIRFQNSFMCHSPDMISPSHSHLELLGGHCSFSIICGQFMWRDC